MCLSLLLVRSLVCVSTDARYSVHVKGMQTQKIQPRILL